MALFCIFLWNNPRVIVLNAMSQSYDKFCVENGVTDRLNVNTLFIYYESIQ